MGLFNNGLFRHKQGWLDFNPHLYLLEILSTRSGAPRWQSATGTLTANSGQTVTCQRAASAYCLGDDGLLHLLGPNTVCVEPSGLLVEGWSTNLNDRSGIVGWNLSGAALTGSAATGPDGLTSAVKFQTIAGNSQHITYEAASPVSTALHTMSVYAKAGTVNFLCVSMGNNSFGRATFDLSNGTFSLVNGTASVQALPNGWYRCTVTYTPVAGDSFMVMSVGDTAAHADYNVGGGAIWPAAGTEYVFVAGAQHEALPFATSLIVTTGAAATRDAGKHFVDNPLFPLSQPVPAWRSGVKATATDASLWSTNFGNVYLYTGNAYPEGSPDSWIVGLNNGVGAGMTFNIWDVSFGTFKTARNTAFNTAQPLAFVDTTDPAGAMTMTGQTFVGGGGDGMVAAFDTPLNIGGNAAQGHYIFCGHFTDLYMDNT